MDRDGIRRLQNVDTRDKKDEANDPCTILEVLGLSRLVFQIKDEIEKVKLDQVHQDVVEHKSRELPILVDGLALSIQVVDELSVQVYLMDEIYSDSEYQAV